MSLNYNIALLKTIKGPIDQSFKTMVNELEMVIKSEKKPSEMSLVEMSNIVGSLQMVGRPSLVIITKNIKEAMEKIQLAEKLNWDHIRISAIAKLTLNLLRHTQEHVHALERGERDLAVRLWPSWSKLQVMLEQKQPSTHSLFDPDPIISSNNFAALERDVLRTQCAPLLEKFNAALNGLISQKESGDIEVWNKYLRQLGEVFDGVYALKHRLGHQSYWLAARARIALELITPTDRDALIEIMRHAQVEIKKFSEDSRKPNPAHVQEMISPMLERWPDTWPAAHHVFAEMEQVFDLPGYWMAQDETRDAENQKSEVAFVAKQDELLDELHNIKTIWTKLSGSNQADVRPFLRALTSFLPKYELFPNPGVKPLMEALRAVAQRFITAKNTSIPHSFSQEVAVSLLLIEETVERKGRWSVDLQDQADLTKKRVIAAAQDRLEDLAALPQVVWGPEKRRQQSQEAVSRVITEVLSDLQFIEETFDEFFRRDYEDAKTQHGIVKQKAMTDAAVLRALGQNSAASIMDIVVKCTSVLNRDGKPQEFKNEYKMLTLALTGLTSFLSSFGKGDRHAMNLLEPALSYFGLIGKLEDKRFEDFDGANSFFAHGSSVMPQQEMMDEEQRNAQDAFDMQKEFIDTVTDPEITEAFMEESETVFGRIRDLRDQLKADPENADLLGDLRRQFHTMKGSGRTSLLWGIAEYGRRIEVRFNEALSKKEKYSKGLDFLTSQSLDFFTHSLSEIKKTNKFIVSPQIIRNLERDLSLSYDDIYPDASSLSSVFAEQNIREEPSDDVSHDRLEQEEQERQEVARALQEEESRLEAERLAQEEESRLEAERLEAERLEAERLEAERLEAERLEAERLEAERLEAERLEAERLEAERLEAERLEAERLEAERLLQEEESRLEAARLEAERLAQEEESRLEAERLEAERLEAERLEEELLESERIEAARLLQEEESRLEAARLEAERLEAERLETERLEAERLEAERIEAARLLQEEENRLEAERVRQEEADVLDVEKLEKEHSIVQINLEEDLERAPLSAADFLNDEDFDENQWSAIKHDMGVHISNLEKMLLHKINVNSLHWSAHTLSSLGRDLDQDRFSRLCKNLENKIDFVMEDEDAELSPSAMSVAEKVIAVILEKAKVLVSSPSAALEWDFLDHSVEEELENSDFRMGHETKDIMFNDLSIPVEKLYNMEKEDAEKSINHISEIMAHLEGLQQIFIKILNK